MLLYTFFVHVNELKKKHKFEKKKIDLKKNKIYRFIDILIINTDLHFLIDCYFTFMFSTIGSTKRDSSVTDMVSGVGISSQFGSIEMGGIFFTNMGCGWWSH